MTKKERLLLGLSYPNWHDHHRKSLTQANQQSHSQIVDLTNNSLASDDKLLLNTSSNTGKDRRRYALIKNRTFKAQASSDITPAMY